MSINYEDTGKYSLGYHLHLAFSALTDTLNQELKKAGLNLTHPQFSILQAVFRSPGLSQSKLAEETAKDGGAITRSLNYLEKQELIERKWINGCTKGVFPTGKAERLKPALDNAIRNTIDQACACFGMEAIASLNEKLIDIKNTLSRR